MSCCGYRQPSVGGIYTGQRKSIFKADGNVPGIHESWINPTITHDPRSMPIGVTRQIAGNKVVLTIKLQNGQTLKISDPNHQTTAIVRAQLVKFTPQLFVKMPLVASQV